MMKMRALSRKQLCEMACAASMMLPVLGQIELPAQALVRSDKLVSKSAQQSRSSFPFNPGFKPPGDGRPKKTQGAAGRDGLRCSETESAIHAFIPPGGYGLTVQERPEIWLDFGKNQVPQVLLLFKSESGQPLERVLLPVEEGQSLRRFALPSTSPALEVGRNYHWSLLVSCDGTINPNHPIFSGWVQRVAQSSEVVADTWPVTMGPSTVGPITIEPAAAEQVKLYAEQGYWYDAVSLLQASLAINPMDSQLQRLWQNLQYLLNLSRP